MSTNINELRNGRVITDRFIMIGGFHLPPGRIIYERTWKFYDGGTESEEITKNTFERLKQEGWRRIK